MYGDEEKSKTKVLRRESRHSTIYPLSHHCLSFLPSQFRFHSVCIPHSPSVLHHSFFVSLLLSTPLSLSPPSSLRNSSHGISSPNIYIYFCPLTLIVFPKLFFLQRVDTRNSGRGFADRNCCTTAS